MKTRSHYTRPRLLKDVSMTSPSHRRAADVRVASASLEKSSAAGVTSDAAATEPASDMWKQDFQSQYDVIEEVARLETYISSCANYVRVYVLTILKVNCQYLSNTPRTCIRSTCSGNIYESYKCVDMLSIQRALLGRVRVSAEASAIWR